MALVCDFGVVVLWFVGLFYGEAGFLCVLVWGVAFEWYLRALYGGIYCDLRFFVGLI